MRTRKKPRTNLLPWIVAIAVSVVLMVVGHRTATVERGYEAFGGEFLIPAFVLIPFFLRHEIALFWQI